MHRFDFKRFHELTLDELYEIMWLRNIVFVVGQKITSEPEIDGFDRECVHAMLQVDGRLVGTARIFAGSSPMKVGRVAVHTDEQGKGYGTILMRHIQDEILAEHEALLYAQAHLEPWYTSLGWVREGDVFVEAEIDHVAMRRQAQGI